MEIQNEGYILKKDHLFIKDKKTISLASDNEFVLVKVLFCGICGGDYSCYIGRRNSYPISLGHEFVAKIIEVGNNVTEYKAGDIVVSDLNFRCGECEFCLSGKSHLCISNNIELFSNRAFYQYMIIHSSYLVKLETIDELYRYSLVEPLSCIIHAFDHVSMPHTLLINGCGSIGMLAAFYAKFVLKIDNIFTRDTIKEKEIALHNCFSISPLDSESLDQFDCIFECSNSVDGAIYIIKKAKSGINICFMSHLYGEETSLIYETICKKELKVAFPLRNGEKNNLLFAHQILKKYWKAKYDSLLAIYDYNKINEVFESKNTNTSCKQILKIASN